MTAIGIAVIIIVIVALRTSIKKKTGAQEGKIIGPETPR